jgi:hypothetical protein
MANARELEVWRRESSAAAVCSPSDHRETISWPVYEVLGLMCSPP